MKREIAELRRVLLQIESGRESFDQSEPSGLYHARLLHDDRRVHVLDATLDSLEIDGLTSRGHDLVDLLRDEQRLYAAQQAAVEAGLDRDHLDAVLGLIRADMQGRLSGG